MEKKNYQKCGFHQKNVVNFSHLDLDFREQLRMKINDLLQIENIDSLHGLIQREKVDIDCEEGA